MGTRRSSRWITLGLDPIVRCQWRSAHVSSTEQLQCQPCKGKLPPETREVPIDHPELTQGLVGAPVERDGPMISRWTDGEAVLPLPAMSGIVMLEIHLAGSMIYAVDAAPEVRRSGSAPSRS